MARFPVLRIAPLLACLLLSSGAAAKTHRVAAGDSLWSLAKKYGVSVEALKAANDLGSDTIRLDQKLTIPGTGDPKPEAAAKDSKPEKGPKKEDPEAKAEPEEEPAKEPAKPAAPPPKPTRAEKAAAVELYSDPARTQVPSTLEERAPEWVLARPGPSTQVQKTNAARGGIFPCAAPDPGFGSYGKWRQVAPMAHVLVPKDLRLDGSGGFDVMFHFHGREPIRKEWVQVMDGAVLIAVDVGIASSSYAEAFKDPRTFGEVLRATEAQINEHTKRKDSRIRHVGVSAWSAGYGALQQLLTQPYPLEVIDSVVLLDGLHSGYVDKSLDITKLAPFARFAERAAREEVFMFVSHSSILTPGYASTTETAQYLVWRLGGKPMPSTSAVADPMGLERISFFSKGNFHVRGFRGNGAADHCAHLGLMRDVLRVHVKPRWEERLTPPSETDSVLALSSATEE